MRITCLILPNKNLIKKPHINHHIFQSDPPHIFFNRTHTVRTITHYDQKTPKDRKSISGKYAKQHYIDNIPRMDGGGYKKVHRQD